MVVNRGFRNTGASCYIDAILSSIMYSPALSPALRMLAQCDNECVVCGIKKAKDALAGGRTTSTEWLPMQSLVPGYRLNRQEDATEVLGRLLTQLTSDVRANHEGYSQLFELILAGCLVGPEGPLLKSSIILNTQFSCTQDVTIILSEKPGLKPVARLEGSLQDLIDSSPYKLVETPDAKLPLLFVVSVEARRDDQHQMSIVSCPDQLQPIGKVKYELGAVVYYNPVTTKDVGKEGHYLTAVRKCEENRKAKWDLIDNEEVTTLDRLPNGNSVRYAIYHRKDSTATLKRYISKYTETGSKQFGKVVRAGVQDTFPEDAGARFVVRTSVSHSGVTALVGGAISEYSHDHPVGDYPGVARGVFMPVKTVDLEDIVIIARGKKELFRAPPMEITMLLNLFKHRLCKDAIIKELGCTDDDDLRAHMSERPGKARTVRKLADDRIPPVENNLNYDIRMSLSTASRVSKSKDAEEKERKRNEAKANKLQKPVKVVSRGACPTPTPPPSPTPSMNSNEFMEDESDDGVGFLATSTPNSSFSSSTVSRKKVGTKNISPRKVSGKTTAAKKRGSSNTPDKKKGSSKTANCYDKEPPGGNTSAQKRVIVSVSSPVPEDKTLGAPTCVQNELSKGEVLKATPLANGKGKEKGLTLFHEKNGSGGDTLTVPKRLIVEKTPLRALEGPTPPKKERKDKCPWSLEELGFQLSQN